MKKRVDELYKKSERYWALVKDFPTLCDKYKEMQEKPEPKGAFESAQHFSALDVAWKNVNMARNELSELHDELADLESDYVTRIDELKKAHDKVVKTCVNTSIFGVLAGGLLLLTVRLAKRLKRM